MSGIDDLTWSDADVPSLPVDTAAIVRLKAAHRRKRARRFVKGPLPLEWLARAARAHPRGLEAVLAIKMAVDQAEGRFVRLPVSAMTELGLTKDSRSRAVAALEHAGLVHVERAPGRLLRVSLAGAYPGSSDVDEPPVGSAPSRRPRP